MLLVGSHNATTSRDSFTMLNIYTLSGIDHNSSLLNCDENFHSVEQRIIREFHASPRIILISPRIIKKKKRKKNDRTLKGARGGRLIGAQNSNKRNFSRFPIFPRYYFNRLKNDRIFEEAEPEFT